MFAACADAPTGPHAKALVKTGLALASVRTLTVDERGGVAAALRDAADRLASRIKADDEVAALKLQLVSIADAFDAQDDATVAFAFSNANGALAEHLAHAGVDAADIRVIERTLGLIATRLGVNKNDARQ